MEISIFINGHYGNIPLCSTAVEILYVFMVVMVTTFNIYIQKNRSREWGFYGN